MFCTFVIDFYIQSWANNQILFKQDKGNASMVVGTKEPTASRPAYVEVTPTGALFFYHNSYNMTSNKNQTQSVVSYSYQNNPIRFSVNSSVMVNATNMAKPFGKTTKDWLRTQQSQEFVATLSTIRHNCPLVDLVQVKQGGINPGTWFHEDVALEFARWLSPAFAIWCNDRIKEILQNKSMVDECEIESLKQINAYLKESLQWWTKEARWNSKWLLKECKRSRMLIERLGKQA